MNRSIRRASQAAVIVVAAALVVRIIAEDYAAFTQVVYTTDPALLLAGFTALVASKLVDRYTWKMMMSSLGHPLGLLRSMELISLFQVASYLPGGVWHFIGISYWAEDEVPKKVTAVGTAINEAVALLAALTVFFAITPVYLSLASFSRYLPLLLILPAAAVALHPRVFYPVLNAGLTWIGQDTVEAVMGYSQLLAVFAVKMAAWSVRGAAFYLIMRAIGEIGLSLAPAVTALYAGAWAVGLLVFFVPGGLGVREVTGISFLSLVVPPSVATVFMVAVRVMVFIEEFLLAGIFMVLSGKLGRGRPNTS